ncbi:FUSC family protein [Shewanella surugensis]|uniref:FUSC family protein n=1 Tax=Shewanella surugensis TaxID=212020 RepID=A0ABT0LFG0_9GAMM|nr:FUSC family protein [Shewanella surugensis]MCL1125886.1 FUSC family protein [Shewanella surugensis]
MLSAFEQVRKDINQQLSHFSLIEPHVQLTLKASLAVVLALFLAVLFQTQEPYWAGISAFVAIQPTVGNTIAKSLERMIGTIIGAMLGIVVIALFITQPIMFSISIFMFAFLGIYFASVIETKAYTWLFIYVTGIMILLAGLNNPTPANFINVAFFRSLEIIIGVLSSMFISILISPLHAHKQLRQSVIQLLDQAITLTHANNQYVTESTSLHDKQNKKYQYDTTNIIHIIRKNLTQQDKLLLFSQHEIKPDSTHNQLIEVLPVIRNINSLLMYSYHFHHNNITQDIRSTKLSQAVIQFNITTAKILKHYQALLTTKKVFATFTAQQKLELQQLNQQLNNHFQQLDASLLEQKKTSHQDPNKNKHDSPLECYEWINYFKQIQFEMNHLFSRIFKHNQENKKTSTPKNQQENALFDTKLNRYFHYDEYYFKHALIGAAAILFTPFIWLYFSLPGYYQIAVSIAVCFNLSTDTTRNKGYYRILGCLIGAVIAILVLSLDIDNFAIILTLVFFIVFSFCLLHFSNATSMSVGTQAAVVFIIGTVDQLSPNTSLAVPIERFGGIILGVISVIIFQFIFWPYQKKDELKHHYALLISRFNQHFKTLFSPQAHPSTLSLWDNQGRHSLSYLKLYLYRFEQITQGNNIPWQTKKEQYSQTSIKAYYSLQNYLLNQEQTVKPKVPIDDILVKESYRLLALPIEEKMPQNIIQDFISVESKLADKLKGLFSSPDNNKPETPNANSLIEIPTASYLSLLSLCKNKRALLEEYTEFNE